MIVRLAPMVQALVYSEIYSKRIRIDNEPGSLIIGNMQNQATRATNYLWVSNDKQNVQQKQEV